MIKSVVPAKLPVINVDHTIVGVQHPDDRIEQYPEEDRINVHYLKMQTPKGAHYVPIYGIIKNAQHLHIYTKLFFETVFSWGMPDRNEQVAVKNADGSIVRDKHGKAALQTIHMRSDIADFYKRAEAAGDIDWIKQAAEKVGFTLPEA